MFKATNAKFLKLSLIIVLLTFFGWFTFFKPTRLGLDLKGGVSILLEVYDPNAEKVRADLLKELEKMLDKKINRLGVTEPLIQVIASKNLLIEIPAVDKVEDALKMLGKTSVLELKIKNSDGSFGETVVTGEEINEAKISINSNGEKAILIEPTPDGLILFKKFAKRSVKNEVATLLGNKEQTLSIDNIKVSGDNVIISRVGGFSDVDARRLVILMHTAAPILNVDNLPLYVKVGSSRAIGANLGSELIYASIKSGALAAFLISIFMIACYFLMGLVSMFSLAIFGIMSFGSLNMLNATLTLPGIAGFILSLGMAVDANVIIFEMIREEIGKGATVKNGINAGFKRAFSAISDANITTLLSTAVLFVFGVGAIRGYAVTLSLGIIISLFTSIFVSKVLLELAVNIFGINNPKLFRVNTKKGVKFTHFNFIKHFNITSGVAISLVMIALGSLLIKGFDKGIDFTGGNMLQLKFEKPLDEAKFTKDIEYFNKNIYNTRSKIEFSVDGWLENVTEKNDVIIRTADISRDIKAKMYQFLKSKHGSFEVEREDTVEPTVGKSLKWNAIKSVVLASILISIFLAIRFEVKYALSAIAEVAHDVIISVGVISLLGYEISSSFIVAILTILGYSTNNSVILFDRIRYNSKNVKIESLEDSSKLINDSVNQVLSRTINTSATVLFAIISLLAFSGEDLKTLLVTFLVGVISGTYSTIYVAAPVVYLFDKIMLKRRKAKA